MMRQFLLFIGLLSLVQGCSYTQVGDTINLSILQGSSVDLVIVASNPPPCGTWSSGLDFTLATPPMGISAEVIISSDNGIEHINLKVDTSVAPTLYPIPLTYSFTHGDPGAPIICSGTINIAVLSPEITY